MNLARARLFTPFFFALAIAGCALKPTAVDVPVVAVTDWGGTPADPARARRHSITHITLHHQGEPFKAGTDPRQYLRKLQTWSRNTKGWLDIPYHYIIDLEGKTYAGRDIAYAGDTNTEYDPSGHALIEVVGNFEEVEPNAAQLAAVVDVMAMLAKKYKVPVERIASHRDHDSKTVCPGANLYSYVQSGYFREKVAARLAQSAGTAPH
ncbi:peptidoglycan recognition family protein [Massilia niabensis]|uniref:Peptidoglycan recognition family protein n=1 Tax=Massilia niabensis TaxID=544910 RepID=A0ABW0L313_9BURK